VYAHIGTGMMNPKWARDPYRVYVPNSLSGTVSEINPHTFKIIRTFPVGGQPNHVTPSWNGSVLWVNNTDGYSLTPISPKTGKPGRPVPVADPYNLYFTPDGKNAMVMAEALTRIDFRSPRTMRLRHSTHVPCAGVNHMDFTADGRDAVASCEFSAKLLWINISKRKVERTLTLGKPLGAPVTPPGPAMSTRNGRLLAKIPVGAGPHGVCVFPQPGRAVLTRSHGQLPLTGTWLLRLDRCQGGWQALDPGCWPH
jgi:YVTN family beta-propeller protein